LRIEGAPRSPARPRSRAPAWRIRSRLSGRTGLDGVFGEAAIDRTYGVRLSYGRKFTPYGGRRKMVTMAHSTDGETATTMWAAVRGSATAGRTPLSPSPGSTRPAGRGRWGVLVRVQGGIREPVRLVCVARQARLFARGEFGLLKPKTPPHRRRLRRGRRGGGPRTSRSSTSGTRFFGCRTGCVRRVRGVFGFGVRRASPRTSASRKQPRCRSPGSPHCRGLRDHAKVQPGPAAVLVNGASGGVGTFAVQIAKALGRATSRPCAGTRNVERAQLLGADRVIDYTQEDFTRSNEEL